MNIKYGYPFWVKFENLCKPAYYKDCDFAEINLEKGYLNYLEGIVRKIRTKNPGIEFTVHGFGDLLKLNDNDIKEQIDFSKKIGSKIIIFHVKEPGVYLSENEFNTYIQKIREMCSYSNGIEICVETGGVTPSQIERVLNETKAKIIYDTSHVILDNEKINEKFDINFFEKLIEIKRLAEIHVCSVKKNGWHTPLFVNSEVDGIDYLNRYVLKRVEYESKNGNVIPLLIEIYPDRRNIEFIQSVVKPSTLILIAGLQASGKTTLRKLLAERLNAKYVSSDDLRSKIKTPNYTLEETKKVYRTLAEKAAELLVSNDFVIAEATFWKKEFRDYLISLAEKIGSNVKIIKTTCSKDSIKKRLLERGEKWCDIYKEYEEKYEEIEREHLEVDTSNGVDLQKIIEYLNAHC